MLELTCLVGAVLEGEASSAGSHCRRSEGGAFLQQYLPLVGPMNCPLERALWQQTGFREKISSGDYLRGGLATSGTKYEKTIPLNENCYFANPILKYFISSVLTVLPILAAKSPWKPTVPYLFPDCSQPLPSHSSTLLVLI